jgi:ABC-2 type transport system ATP-binding protein
MVISMNKEQTILTIENLEKHYGETIAVDKLSFQVKAGEIYGLLGPNGSGKSTTIKSIMGMLEIEGGSIQIFNIDPIRDPIRAREMVGYVAEEQILFESMTPEEIFNFIASIRKLDPVKTKNRMEKLLSSFDAMKYYKSMIASLSKGNKQKIQILTSLIHSPKLLILDEPLSGLDAKSSLILREIFQMHIKKGGSILLSTHIMEHAQSLCTRIGIINRGRLQAEGTLSELQEIAKSNGNLEEIFLMLTDQSEDALESLAMLREEEEL